MPYRKLLLGLSFWYVLSGMMVAIIAAKFHPPLVHIYEGRLQRSLEMDPWPDATSEAWEKGDFLVSTRMIVARNFGKEFMVFSAIPSSIFPPWALFRTHMVAWNAGLNLAYFTAFEDRDILLVTALFLAGPERIAMHGLLLFGALEIIVSTVFSAALGFPSRKAAYLSGLRRLGMIIVVCAAISVGVALLQSLMFTSLHAGGV